MDRSDVALQAVRETMRLNCSGAGDGHCASAIETVVPFFPAVLRQQCRIVSVDAGRVLLKCDGEESSIHRVMAGDVSVQREMMGEAVTLQRAAAGDWLIETGMGMQAADAFVLCERQSTLLSVPASALAECLERESGFAHAWCLEMGEQAARMQRRIERISLRHALQRVVHYLATESPGGCGEMALPFRNRVWAAHLGMAPETLSRTLTDLADAGWLEKLQGNRYRLLRMN